MRKGELSISVNMSKAKNQAVKQVVNNKTKFNIDDVKI